MVEPPCRGRRRAAADAGRASAAAAAGAPEGAQGGQPVGAQGPRALRKLIEDLQPSQRILSERQLARRLHLQSRTLAISNAQWHHMLGTGQRQRWAQQRVAAAPVHQRGGWVPGRPPAALMMLMIECALLLC